MTQTITFIGNGGGLATATVTTTVDAPAGSMLLAVLAVSNEGFSNPSVSDSGLNTWKVNAAGGTDGGTVQTATCILVNDLPIGSTVTAVAGAAVNFMLVISAMTGVNALDTSTAASAVNIGPFNGTATPTVTSDTLNQADEIVVQYGVTFFASYNSFAPTSLFNSSYFSSSYDIVTSTVPVSFPQNLNGTFSNGYYTGYTESYFFSVPPTNGNFLIMFR